MTKDEAIEVLREALQGLIDFSHEAGFDCQRAVKAMADTATIEAPTSEAVAWWDRAVGGFYLSRESIPASIANSGRIVELFAAPVLDAVGVEKPQQGNTIRPSAAPAGRHDAEPWVLEAVVATYLLREMPPGTVVGNPAWWATRIAAAIERELPGRCIANVANQADTKALRDALWDARAMLIKSTRRDAEQMAVISACSAALAAQPAAAPAPTDAGIPISDERASIGANLEFHRLLDNVCRLSHVDFKPSHLAEARYAFIKHIDAWRTRGQQPKGGVQ